MPRDSRGDIRTEIPDGADQRRQAPARHGAGNISAILPNGRVVWLRVDPEFAPAESLQAAAAAADHAAQSRQTEAAANTNGIHRLARMLARDSEQVSVANLERLERLRREAAAGDGRVARRLSKAREEFRSRVAKQIAIERAAVDRLAQRDLWDKIAIATSLPLFAAYGERGNPFGSKNVALLVSLAIWLVGDEVRDALFGSDERDKRSPYPVRDMDSWSYLAPVLNLLAGWWLMSGYQHDRFVAGLTAAFAPRPAVFIGGKVRHAYVATVDLSRLIAPLTFAEFASFEDVAAVVTPRVVELSAAGVAASATIEAISAVVRGGVLEIRLVVLGDQPNPMVDPPPSVIKSADVAFVVDTRKPDTTSQ